MSFIASSSSRILLALHRVSLEDHHGRFLGQIDGETAHFAELANHFVGKDGGWIASTNDAGRHERRVRPSTCIRADVVGAHDIRR